MIIMITKKVVSTFVIVNDIMTFLFFYYALNNRPFLLQYVAHIYNRV